MKKLFLSLILVLLVSGCANLPFDIPFLDGGGPNITKLGPDVIVIQNINVIPKTSVRPDDSFSVYFEVKNQDENERVPDVSYKLYDTGLCEWIEGDPNSKFGTWSNGFAPSETKLVEWDFEAPSAADIAHLRIKCPIKFKINYSYNAKSQIDVVVIDKERLRELQRSGEDVIYVPSLSMGRGPIKIYFDFGNTLPVRDSTNLSVYIKIKDEGVGLLGEISNKTDKRLVIKAHNFTKITCIEDYFTCDNTKKECENTEKPIPLIKKQTFEIRCELETPDVEMEKTYYITAELNYDYDVLGEVNVGIEP